MGVKQGSDEILVRQMQSADPTVRSEAWRVWYEQGGPALMRYIHRRCPSHAEDIFQDCLKIGIERISGGQYRYRGKPIIAYLKGIARNLIYVEYRSAKRKAPLTRERDDRRGNDLSLAADDEADAVDERIDQESRLHRVTAAMAKLEKRKRLVLVKRFLESKSPSEAGEEMGMSPGHVRVETHRALKALREALS